MVSCHLPPPYMPVLLLIAVHLMHIKCKLEGSPVDDVGKPCMQCEEGQAVFLRGVPVMRWV